MNIFIFRWKGWISISHYQYINICLLWDGLNLNVTTLSSLGVPTISKCFSWTWFLFFFLGLGGNLCLWNFGTKYSIWLSLVNLHRLMFLSLQLPPFTYLTNLKKLPGQWIISTDNCPEETRCLVVISIGVMSLAFYVIEFACVPFFVLPNYHHWLTFWIQF